MTSISGKVARSKSSMYGKLDTLDRSECLSSEDLLKKLYVNIGSSLNGLLQNFALGNFMEVKNELTKEKFNRLSVAFRNNSMPGYLYYEIVRLLFSKTLDGLMQSINQYLTLLDTTGKLEQCKVYSEILNDPERLKEYLEKLKNQRYLFNVEPVTMIETVIKREYLEYIKLYGFPQGGVFKSDLLADIIHRIENDLPMVALPDYYNVTNTEAQERREQIQEEQEQVENSNSDNNDTTNNDTISNENLTDSSQNIILTIN